MTFEITWMTNPVTLLEINNAAVPDLNEITLLKAEWMMEHCVVPNQVMLDGKVAGAIVVLSDHCGFDSDYYRWFTARYENFLYIDRVIVVAWARGRGVAKSIYAEVERVANEKQQAIVADVYAQPPNMPSLQLHRSMGFEEIAQVYMPGVGKTVSKLVKYKERAKQKI